MDTQTTIAVSVIIPVYNSASLLRECLTSLKEQTVLQHSFEVIVVDDGSTDDSASVAEEFGALVLRQQNQGPAEARNSGVEASKGDLLLYTDADCVVAPDWIEEMIRPFEDPSVSGTRGRYKTRQRSLVARFAQVEYEEKYEILKRSDSIDFIDTSSAGYRRSVFREAGGFSKKFTVASGEDTDLSYRLAEAGHRLVFCPDAIVFHTHPSELAHYLRRKYKTAYWRTFLYQQHPGKMVRDSHTPQTFKFQILSLYATCFFSLLLPFFSWSAIGAGLGGLCFLLVSLPFLIFCFTRDPVLSFAAPIFIFLRTLVFCVGLVLGSTHLFATRLSKAEQPEMS